MTIIKGSSNAIRKIPIEKLLLCNYIENLITMKKGSSNAIRKIPTDQYFVCHSFKNVIAIFKDLSNLLKIRLINYLLNFNSYN